MERLLHRLIVLLEVMVNLFGNIHDGEQRIMTIDIERIKLATLIEDVVGETHPLTGNARYRKGADNDSLVVDVERQYYVWNSVGHSGDVISWLENTRRWSFRQAVEWLADRAGIPMVLDDRAAAAYMTARRRSDVLTVVAEFLQAKFSATPAAAAYAEGRGWPAQVAADAGLGYWDGDRKGLTGHLEMHDLSRPAGSSGRVGLDRGCGGILQKMVE